MNLSETAFLERREEGWSLRWFTPAIEVDLCGHATLASAHVLWEQQRENPGSTIPFHTRSGLLTARREGAWIELDFPATPPAQEPVPAGLDTALGAPVSWFGWTRFDAFAVLESEAAIRGLAPDVGNLPEGRGIIVTAQAERPDGDYAFVSRFFAPAAGVPEDPVTGSAHCALAPYWGARLGRDSMTGYQASARGGIVRTRIQGDRVLLGGQAVTTLRGELSDA
jgi:predicted PhzF superfamily epimerase YddE/YHI9